MTTRGIIIALFETNEMGLVKPAMRVANAKILNCFRANEEGAALDAVIRFSKLRKANKNSKDIKKM
jgi:hypothetical protein